MRAVAIPAFPPLALPPCSTAATFSFAYAPVSWLRAVPAAEFGIDKRTPWTTSKFVGSPEPPLPYVVERAFEHLNFTTPDEMQIVPGSNRLAVCEVKGKVLRSKIVPM